MKSLSAKEAYTLGANRPLVIAHRGAKGYAPENTLAAFQYAKNLNSSWIECDVKLSADHHPVIIHDHTLERTSNGHGKVINHTLEALQRLDAGTWFSQEFCTETIPTLAQTLSFCDQHNLALNLEIKPDKGLEQATVAAILPHIITHHQKAAQPILVSSFCTKTLQHVYQAQTGIEIAVLGHQLTDDLQATARAIHAIAIHLDQRLIQASMIQAVKHHGFLLGCYTVNDASRGIALANMGVDAIFSDQPDLLQAKQGDSAMSFPHDNHF